MTNISLVLGREVFNLDKLTIITFFNISRFGMALQEWWEYPPGTLMGMISVESQRVMASGAFWQ